MRRFTLLAAGVLLAAAAMPALAQGDSTKTKPDSAAKAPAGAANLEGTWTGSISTPQGEMPVNAKIKKGADGFVGTISGLEGDVPLKDITLDGDKVTAGAVMSMQGQGFEVWYSFVLKGDTMTGGVSASVQGQTMAFDLVLKRAP
jgi:hypothetical protein